MENKFYITTYWQSLDLMQAKFDKNTADYVYVRYDGVPHPRLRTKEDYFNATIIPAWSITKLWELFYKAKMTYEYSTDMTPQEVLNSMVQTAIYYAETITP